METNFIFNSTQTKVSPFDFIWGMTKNPLETLTSFAKKYGDITHIQMPRRNFYFVNHPDFIEEVLVKQQSNFVKGPALQRARIILGEGLLTSEGEEHLVQRRALQPAFHRHKMEEYLPLMNENTFCHIAKWEHDNTVDMAEEMMQLTLNIALWSFFGNAPQDSVERVSEAMKTLFRLFPLAQLPLPDVTRLFFSKFRQAKADLDQITEALIKNPTQTENVKRALIHILKENNKNQFTESQIHAHTLTFLLAGHETTALLLAWCWDMLAHHPQAQTKLQNEVDDVLGNRFPTSEDIQKLTYTHSIVQETLRMRPSAWAMGRQAVKNCMLGEQEIKADDVVVMSQWVMHHDARFYDAPLQFHPERWVLNPKQNLPRYAYFPFGGGNRICIGEHFAMTEAVAVLAMIARKWKVTPINKNMSTPKPSVTLRPSAGVKVLIEKR
jgi:cytochrome P450